jgi:hypothetical protein
VSISKNKRRCGSGSFLHEYVCQGMTLELEEKGAIRVDSKWPTTGDAAEF